MGTSYWPVFITVGWWDIDISYHVKARRYTDDIGIIHIKDFNIGIGGIAGYIYLWPGVVIVIGYREVGYNIIPVNLTIGWVLDGDIIDGCASIFPS